MWYNDAKLLSGLGDALSVMGILEDSDDFSAFLRKPQRYNEEYAAWETAGFPTSEDDDGWEEFEEALTSDGEDDDEDDET